MASAISFPSGENLLNVIQGYHEEWGFPMCGDAIDGTHVPILAPNESDADYRAVNNGRSTDNVRPNIGFVRSNSQMAGQFVRSFTLVRHKFRVSRFKYLKVQCYYYQCLSGQKWDMSEEK